MPPKNYKGIKHEWLQLVSSSGDYSGFDWCKKCGTVRTRSETHARKDYFYKKPESFKAKLFNIHTNGIAPTSKICSNCQKEKDLSEFGKCKPNLDGLKYLCRSCFREYYDKNREKILARQRAIPSEIKIGYVRKYERANPEKKKAQMQINEALRTGQIDKLLFCTDCDKEKPLDGHHEDYDKPLDVIWVCRACHKLRHMANPFYI